MITNARYVILIIGLLILPGCSSLLTTTDETDVQTAPTLIKDFKSRFAAREFNFEIPAASQITDFKVDSVNKEIVIETNNRFSFRFFREKDIDSIYAEVQNYFIPFFMDYKFTITSITFPIEELVPNIYRHKMKLDESRMPVQQPDRPLQVVRNISKPFKISKGLQNNNIAMWHSHGWYYNYKLDRWLWQRARLFQVVEDMGPISFVLPYITPMLENAGANVYLPRERDTQLNEVVIDNDDYIYDRDSKNYTEFGNWRYGKGDGFLYGEPPYEANFNPFLGGLHRITETSSEATAQIEYIPTIPESGEYAVNISYVASPDNAEDAHYTVHHLGGKTEFLVNQTIGGNSWYYLGTFKFAEGTNPDLGSVIVDNKSQNPNKLVSADVVRFGGGMGIVERGGAVSGRPKFVEGSRYYLQYAGMPDTLVYNINGDTLDYTDDYQSRGEWVNYLVGNPCGPNKDRTKGLGIPIDLSLAFHTDAGITRNDTVIGTLSIYSVTDYDSNYVFPDGVSRLANRDLADIMQTQIVNDIKAKYDSVWNRRQLYDGRYSEAARPNVPSVLLELLSHQNFLDNKFQLDPRYRFDVARSIYKSMIRFIANEHQREYVIQPLPVTDMATQLNEDGSIQLSWQPRFDPLEKTAVATGYVVYRRIGDGGFDNGVYVAEPTYKIDGLGKGVVYSFKVTAVNAGGESFPSEILSVGFAGKNSNTAVVINAFDRISGPACIESDKFTGFVNFYDAGVPDKYDLSYTGQQYNFTPVSRWGSDDAPGHGASHANFETKVIAGNTFDFTKVHGEALLKNGWSFISVSDEAASEEFYNLNKYDFVDIIFGEEKETEWPKKYSEDMYGKQFKTFNEKFQEKISEYLTGGGNVFLSGSYIGSDLFLHKPKDDPGKKFAIETLKYRLDSDHAVVEGDVYSIRDSFIKKNYTFNFNTVLNDSIYAVEAPDALGEINGSETLLRYKENLYSAAIGYKDEYGIVSMGFPFETITSDEARNELMNAVLVYLKLK